MKGEKLTAKQAMFVKEYLIDLNATQAAIRAGYSKKTAPVIGLENLRKPLIAKAIDEEKEKRIAKLERTADEVMADIHRIAGKAEDEGRYGEALKALELEGKHMGAFTEKIEHSGNIGGDMKLLKRQAMLFLEENREES